MTDELAARRLPDWAKKLAEIRLGAMLGVGVMPHAKWIAENPGVPATECPEHLLEVAIAIIGAETRPQSLNPDPDSWPSVTLPPFEVMRVPWSRWREQADAAWAAEQKKVVMP